MDSNRLHYDKLYQNVNVDSILKVLDNLETYMATVTSTHISWVGMYMGDFQSKVAGMDILELGCGDCRNAAILAALGARVVANDISERSCAIVAVLNDSYPFKHPIRFVSGDFTTSDLPAETFDFVIGKAFLHHLTLDLEKEILKKVAYVLKRSGEARFFETAVNSKVLDELRWATPMNDRPSKWFQPKAFKQWEASDPHPPRDNSSAHYSKVGHKFFRTVQITPLGIFERFNRLLPINQNNMGHFKRKALEFEAYVPLTIRSFGARSQVVIYRNPK
ncbi:class I SAM-dependent methyltransferase [Gelidibacter salicanalis]|nr:class I SAM-dependent methyltransferase [Gelidibacter salicanalis]